MHALTIGPDGEITFDDDMLRHLGVGPGDDVEVELLSNGYLSISAASRKEISELQV